MRRTHTFAAIAIAFAALFVGQGQLVAQEQRPRGINVSEQTTRGTCWVMADGSSGAGAVIDARKGWILTNYHVVKESTSGTVIFPTYENGKLNTDRQYYWKNYKALQMPMKVLHRDPARDLALVEVGKLPTGVTAIPLADKSVVKGDEVHRVGSPGAEGEPWKFTSAVTSSIKREKFNYPNGQTVHCKCVNNDGPDRPGDSGGPVVNAKGELIGIHAGFAKATKLAFAIDLEEVKAFLDEASK